jgi:UTP--glucose-1-phosphate uridylyltransferase
LEQERLLNVTEFAEKPTLDYARASLHVPGLPDDEYLTVFGQYIIKPQLFGYLEEHIKNNVRERGEFQLTSALDRLRQEDGLLGLMIEGKRFDIGLPDYYLETLEAFRHRVWWTIEFCRWRHDALPLLPQYHHRARGIARRFTTRE